MQAEIVLTGALGIRSEEQPSAEDRGTERDVVRLAEFSGIVNEAHRKHRHLISDGSWRTARSGRDRDMRTYPTTLDAAKRFLLKLPNDRNGSPSPRAFG